MTQTASSAGETRTFLAAFGIRAEKVMAGATVWENYLFAGARLVGMVKQDGASLTTRYFHLDHLGSIHTITDAAGTARGSFAATRVDDNHFLWRDIYGFEMHGWSEPVRNAVTAYGALRAVGGNILKLPGAKPFDIIGTKPVPIPGR